MCFFVFLFVWCGVRCGTIFRCVVVDAIPTAVRKRVSPRLLGLGGSAPNIDIWCGVVFI
jgi:hypothetical protein